MRLRYLAAAPLLAAVMFGTTAAAWPSATADPPPAPPALTSSALSARYAADARAIATAEHAADRDGDSQLAGALAVSAGGAWGASAVADGHAAAVVPNITAASSGAAAR